MILRFILWYLNRRFNYVYNDINEERMKEWLKSINSELSGFRDYFKMRDLTLLKSLGNGLTQKEYWMTVGRRMELLFLIGKSTELLKKEEKEKHDKQE